jgi:hypothetical protein
MKRTLIILLLCVLGAGLAACAVHSDRSLGADSAAAALDDFGCGGPLMVEAPAVALAFLPLTRGLALAGSPPSPERRPVSFFQPPEDSA